MSDLSQPPPSVDRFEPGRGQRSAALEVCGLFVLLVSGLAAGMFWMMWQAVLDEPAGDLAFLMAAIFATCWALVLVGPGIVILAMAAQRRRYVAIGAALAGVLCDFAVIGAFIALAVAILP